MTHFDHFSNLNKTTDLKRECLITIEYDSRDKRAPIRHELYRLKILFEQVAYLIALTTVAMLFTPQQFEIWEGMKHMKDTDWDDEEKTMVKILSLVKGELEPELGPAKLVGDANGEDRGLVFHPKEFRHSLARRQKNSDSSLYPDE